VSGESSFGVKHPQERVRGWFVTGTDTEVGKTTIAAAILRTLARAGYACVGMKPVASGCVDGTDGLRSADAEILQAYSSVKADYRDVNPYAFAPAVAPHLAARAAGAEIALATICRHFDHLGSVADCVVVEGVGGWQVPLTADSTVADLARMLGLPVIVVVGMRLGCLNHALLTIEAISDAGLAIAGWIANRIDPTMALFQENVESLCTRIRAPLLGVVPHLLSGDPAAAAAAWLDLSPLLA
jgi:dethiobiotin synthetase